MKKINLLFALSLLYITFFTNNANAQQRGVDNSSCPDWTETATVINVGDNITLTANPASTCDAGTSTPSPYAGDYLWCFEGGTPSTVQDIGPNTITYNTAGTYYVTLDMSYCVGALCAFDVYCRTKSAWITVSALPVTLLSFTAKSINNSNVLVEWQSATEKNNDYYTIEKSKEGEIWEYVETVDGAGNSSISLSYSLNDKEPYQGTSYYRLTQTDYDGKQKTFPLITTENNMSSLFNVFPNPASNIISIEVNENKDVEISICDVLGREVSNSKISKPKSLISIDISSLSRGIYFLKTISDIGQTQNKFVKE